MAGIHILRFPRSDDAGGFVLVQVTSSGPKSLDLKLLGTEGEEPYVVKLHHDRTANLKVKNCPCPQDEWESILTAVLLDRQASEDVETAASVEGQSSITVTFRKRIQGITQRLGTISLSYKEDEAIELFDWCGESIAARENVKENLVASAKKVQELEKNVADLKSQLEELITAKRDDESELLEKFRDLLNEKKVKIREQQRLQASTNGPPVAKAGVKEESGEEEAHSRRGRKPTRSSKRKAAQAVEESGDESDDAFEKMDVERPNQAPRDERDLEHAIEEDRQTSDDNDDDATASEADEDELPAHNTRFGGAAARKAPQGSKTPAPRDEPPPRRELPFALNKGQSAAATRQPAPAGGGSETESDDEL